MPLNSGDICNFWTHLDSVTLFLKEEDCGGGNLTVHLVVVLQRLLCYISWKGRIFGVTLTFDKDKKCIQIEIHLFDWVVFGETCE